MIYKCPICGRVEIDQHLKDHGYIDQLPEKCEHITEENKIRVLFNLDDNQMNKYGPIELFKYNHGLSSKFYYPLIKEAQRWRDVGHYVYMEYNTKTSTLSYINVSFGLFLGGLKHNINFIITPLDLTYFSGDVEDYIHEIFKHQNHRLWDGIRENFYKGVGKL